MAMWIEQERALAVLGPMRLMLLRRCVEEAWLMYDSVVRPVMPLCSAVGMANVLHELVVQEARNRLHGDLGFRIYDAVGGGRFLATVDGSFALQFRKLTIDLRTRNNPTESSTKFDLQQPGLGEIPDLPRLTVGWQLGQYATSVAEIYLAFIFGSECIWHYDLRTGERSVTLEFPRIDGPSAAEQEAEEERRRKFSDRLEENEEGGAG